MGRFNLNSYFALDALLRTATLTEAAQSINLSQPAMSLALKRLREFFNDELVCYEPGKAARLTPLALKIQPKVATILQDSQNVLNMARAFDAASEIRTFTIAAPDYILSFFLAKLIGAIAEAAPGIIIEAFPYYSLSPSACKADLMILPEWQANPNEPSFMLFRESFGCLVKQQSQLQQFNQKTYLQMDHVALPQDQDEMFWPENSPERALLRRRDVHATVRKIDALQHFVIREGMVATTTLRYAQQQVAISPNLTLCSARSAFSDVTFVGQFRPNRQLEPAMVWLKKVVEGVADNLTPGGLAHLHRK